MRNNIFANRDYLLGILILACWIPIALRCVDNLSSHVATSSFVVLILFSGLMYLVAIYSPIALIMVPLFAAAAWFPESGPPPQIPIETLLSWQKYPWTVLSVVVWIRFLQRRSQKISH